MQLVASRDVATVRRRRPKPRRRFPAEVLTDPEVRALLDACGGPYHPVALRNRALIALMYRAGLRVSEALALSPKDVDLATGVVRVLHGKGDVSRTVGLDAGACAVVARRLQKRTWANVGKAAVPSRAVLGTVPPTAPSAIVSGGAALRQTRRTPWQKPTTMRPKALAR